MPRLVNNIWSYLIIIYYLSYLPYQIKNRLRKEIGNKEEQIITLNQTMNVLTDELKTMQDKQIISERKMNDLIDRTNDYSELINALRTDLHNKERLIEQFQATNQELEQFIKDSRQTRAPNPLDQSVECLDTSMVSSLSPSHTNNGNFSQNSTPESLARSVVDIKLREQQTQNQLLVDQLSHIGLVNRELSEKMANMIEAHEQQMAELLRQFNESEDARIAAKTICVQQHVDEIATLQAVVQRLQTEQIEYESATKRLHDCVAATELKIQQLNMEAESSKRENDNLFIQVNRLNAVNRDLLQQNADKDVQLDELTDRNSQLGSARGTLEEKLTELKALCDDLQSNVREHERVKFSMTTEVDRLKGKLEEVHVKVELLEQLRDSLLKEGEKARQQIRSVDESLAFMKTQKDSLEAKLHEIEIENAKIHESYRYVFFKLILNYLFIVDLFRK